MSVWKQARIPLVASLVTTQDRDGRVNASPKSWWTPTSYEPELLVVSVRTSSDTALNIEETGRFCLHVPFSSSDEVATKVLHTAKPLERGENELNDVGLAWRMTKHPDVNIEFVTIHGMPFFGCMVRSKLESGDHTLYEGLVVLAGLGPDAKSDVGSVLLHRGQNVFVRIGEEWKAERY